MNDVQSRINDVARQLNNCALELCADCKVKYTDYNCQNNLIKAMADECRLIEQEIRANG